MNPNDAITGEERRDPHLRKRLLPLSNESADMEKTVVDGDPNLIALQVMDVTASASRWLLRR